MNYRFITIIIFAATCAVMKPCYCFGQDPRFKKLQEIVGTTYDKNNEQRSYSIRVASDKTIEIFERISEIKKTDLWLDERPAKQAGIYYKLDSEGNVAATKALPENYCRSMRFEDAHRATAQLTDDRWLLLAKPRHDYPSWWYYTMTFKQTGDLISIDSSVFAEVWGENPQAITNHKGNVYAICSYNGMSIRQILPSLDKEETQLNILGEVKGLSIGRFTTIFLDDSSFLLCLRPIPFVHGAYGYKDTELGYAIINTDGTLKKTMKKFDINEYTFAKIKNTFLPGIIADDYTGEKGINPCFDFTRLGDGSIVLSITAYDEKGALCIYQVKFNENGDVIKPQKTKNIKPIALSRKDFPAITKTGLATFSTYYKNDINEKSEKTVKKQVFWGYNEKGDFYWESVPLD